MDSSGESSNLEILLNFPDTLTNNNSDKTFFYISELFYNLIPNSIIIITELTPANKSVFKVVRGVDNQSKEILPILGKNPVGLEVKAYRGDSLDELQSGKLIKLPTDFHAITLGSVDKDISEKLIELLGIKCIYLLAFICDSRRVGGCLILTKNDPIDEINKIQIEKYGMFSSQIIKLNRELQNIDNEDLQFKTIFNQSKEAIVIIKDFKIIKANNSFYKIFELSPTENIEGKYFTDFINEDESNIVKKILDPKINVNSDLNKFESKSFTQENKSIEISVSLTKFNINTENYYFGFIQDVTKRNDIERALREKEEDIRLLFEESPDLILLKNFRNNWLIANNAFINKFNLTNIKKDNLNDYYISSLNKDYKIFFENNKYKEINIWKTRNTLRTEEVIVTENNLDVYDVIRKPFFCNENQPKYLLFQARDITEKANLEKELKNYKNHLEDLIDERARELIKTINSLSNEIAQRKIIEGIINAENSFSNKLLSIETDNALFDLLIETISNLFNVNSWGFFSNSSKIKLINESKENKIFNIISKSKIHNFLKNKKEIEIVCENDNNILIIPINLFNEVKYYIIALLEGKDNTNILTSIKNLVNLSNIALNNIENKKQVTKNLMKWETLIKNMPGGSVLLSEEHTIIDVNDYMCNLLGYKKEEIIGKKCSSICYNETDDCFTKRKNIDSIENKECLAISKSGKFIPIIKSCKKMYFDDEIFFLENILDYSHQKEIELRVNELNKYFLELGIDPLENISKLIELLGKQINADCTLFNKISTGKINTYLGWNLPPDFLSEDKADGHICCDLVKDFSANDLIVLDNLQSSKYKETDINVIKYELKTYIGKVIKIPNLFEGTICAVYTSDYHFNEMDKRIMSIIGTAIGREVRLLFSE